MVFSPNPDSVLVILEKFQLYDYSRNELDFKHILADSFNAWKNFQIDVKNPPDCFIIIRPDCTTRSIGRVVLSIVRCSGK